MFQAKRNRENDRISHLDENNRLNQRIDQLEGRNQQLQDKVTKSKLPHCVPITKMGFQIGAS